MDKKYQVFISSTYKDMKAERQVAVEAILDAGHIPAGMELFAASDKKQIEVIKNWIDRSDIFMLILGGRYGSVETDSGKSYIQLEYEYAVEKGKPFFALYLTDQAIAKKAAGELGLKATEQDDTKAFKSFREKVRGRLCSEIEDLKDIRIHVPKAIRDLSAANNLEGWVRASSVPDLSPLMGQLAALRESNAHLQTSNAHLQKSNGDLQGALRDALAEAAKVEAAKSESSLLPRFTGGFSESSLDTQLQLEISVDMDMEGDYQTHRRAWNGTYRTIFSLIGAKLVEEPADTTIRAYIEKVLREQTHGSVDVRVSESSFQSMKMKFVTLGVIELTKSDNVVCWTLTANGRTLLMKVHADA